jgi:hypothetical protein
MSDREEGSFRDLLQPWLRSVLIVGLGSRFSNRSRGSTL